ncbi:hypothetical protein DYB34_006329 [Aphanomyces astaci]|uniref:WGR domain-containing protein n=2 Tax=Aphanomyces astaci TaxID=112090 RepID=A0A3R6ZDL8_APHAT|nr:hypothetical protein DYB34_006329 [Aphanomyces astaci]
MKRQIPAPVATFGSHSPSTYTGALVHVVPATAFPSIQNASALRGRIAVVQRGDCSFAAKAKSIQAAGAIGMILTNSSEELVRMGEAFEREGAGVDIPVLMVGQVMGKSLRDGTQVVLEVKHELAKIVHFLAPSISSAIEPHSHVSSKPSSPLPPLFAFVLYATSADEFHVQFAPLADFGLRHRKKLYFRSRLVTASPRTAHPSVANKPEFAGAIAFVDRGGCTFPEKIERLQQAGAIAVIVANNDVANPTSAFVMSVDQMAVDHITIPSVMLPYAVAQHITTNPPDRVGIVCIDGTAAGVLLANDTTTYSLWSPPPSSASLPPLLHAARHGHTSQLMALLDQPLTSPRLTDAFNVSALHYACIGGSVAAVELLLAAGAHVDALDLGSQTPLHYACMTPSVGCVQALVTAAAHTLAINEGGSTPLHVACFASSTECMEVLLTATATTDASGKYVFHGVDDVDKSGRTPLHVACRYGHGDCAMYLMAAGANVNIVDAKGWTAMHYVCDRINVAVSSSDVSVKAELHVVEQLLRHGATMVDAKATADDTTLILDRIRSNAVRRDVELLYLRQEVATHRRQAGTWQLEWARMQASMHQVVHTAKTDATAATLDLQRTVDAQQRAIHHMQCQLTSVLHILQGTNQPGAAAGSVDPLAHNHEVHKTDMERAQEAALARDLGRKCMRAKQYALAKSYFETSLQWYGLPGVRRLLDQVNALLVAPLSVGGGGAPKTVSTSVLIRTYRSKLQTAGMSQEVVSAVEAEIAALETVDPTSAQFTMVTAWLDWLVGLPWHDQVPSLDLFRRVNQAQCEDVAAKRNAAAVVVQRAVRHHISARLFHRQWAAVILQARVRGWQTRRKHPKRQEDAGLTSDPLPLRDAQGTTATTTNQPTGIKDVEVDFQSTVDPMLGKPTATVVRGVQLRQGPTKRYILQWLLIPDTNDQYVWTRWSTSDGKVQCALKGPYDTTSDDAQMEFEKIFKLKTHHKWGTSCDDARKGPTNQWAYHPQHYSPSTTSPANLVA